MMTGTATSVRLAGLPHNDQICSLSWSSILPVNNRVLFYIIAQNKTHVLRLVSQGNPIWFLEFGRKNLVTNISSKCSKNFHVVVTNKCTFYLTNHITFFLKFFHFTNCRNIRVRISTGCYWVRISESKKATLKKLSWYFSVTPRQCFGSGNSLMHRLYIRVLPTEALLTSDDVELCYWKSVVK
jgi:hypothetical protein